MESLAPPLKVCLEVRLAMECGHSLLTALRQILPIVEIDFRQDLIRLVYHVEQHGHVNGVQFESKSLHRKSLLAILSAGLMREPIVQRLIDLEGELIFACEEQIDEFVAALPLKGLVPIMLVQLPAFLLLLFGPILREFIQGVLR